MNPKESESTEFQMPVISPKTLNETLNEWSNEVHPWPSEGRNRVAADVIQNGKELSPNSDWGLVLDSIKVAQGYNNSVKLGQDAIAVNGARLIGGLAARAGWSMHYPGSVYLSGKYLVHIAGSKLEDFKTTMTKRAVSYGQKTLPEAELLMKTLDLLLEHQGRKNHNRLVTRIAALFRNGDIQGAYTMVSSRKYPVS